MHWMHCRIDRNNVRLLHNPLPQLDTRDPTLTCYENIEAQDSVNHSDADSGTHNVNDSDTLTTNTPHTTA